ncbi:hypothetical protein PHLGIDRAFT_103985, partial [Phlebiopsis gigantea 11061_1 CR5-6]
MSVATPTTPSGKLHPGSNCRLVYRGALALTDSHLLLDGLSFVVEASGASGNLMENPLALSLETMRGRPSLQLLGTENLKDVWLDATSDIGVYVHPYSTLSQLYFENILCLDPITSAEKRTSLGIRCGLGDGSDPAMTDFLIYGQLVPVPDHENSIPSSSQLPPTMIRMFASRILPGPPQPAARVPRPDDPTPRKPPALAKRKRETSISASFSVVTGSKRSKASVEEEEQIRRAREVMFNMPKAAPSDSTKPKRVRSAKDTFKVPSLPARGGSLDMIGDESPVDVFGVVEDTVKGKAKDIVEKPGSSELEKANKTVSSPAQVIKQATIACLSRYGINKAHDDFNELYQATYRGVCLAMRNIIRLQAATMRTVDRLVQDHL